MSNSFALQEFTILPRRETRSPLGFSDKSAKKSHNFRCYAQKPSILPRSCPTCWDITAWGCPMAPPLHQQKYQVIFQDTIFLLLHILCLFLGASLFFISIFFCFVCCNKWLDPNIFLLEKTHSIFIA
jgi:hypothetical protein